MGLLGVLRLLGVGAGAVGEVLATEPRLDHLASGPHGGLGQCGAVGPHVGDVAVLVQPLGQAHHLAAAHPQPGAAHLLEGRRDERRLGAGCVRLGLDAGDGEGLVDQTRR